MEFKIDMEYSMSCVFFRSQAGEKRNFRPNIARSNASDFSREYCFTFNTKLIYGLKSRRHEIKKKLYIANTQPTEKENIKKTSGILTSFTFA